MKEKNSEMLKLGRHISSFLFEQECDELKGHSQLKDILEKAVGEIKKIVYPKSK